ncbi:flagellin [Opitutales bacterium ASA1]|uniref:flagellin n=1 Tax=Congregicoccus parvus TaxID=3081749 RepID=UPI002B2CCA26|nr:flagellin [Opitutales bacterium ASA1]
MSVVINTNTSATVAYGNLASSNQNLQKSLNRLSSGYKIVQPSDDAGGLAVSMKMSAAIRRTDATSTNVANAQSFLQVQDGALKTAGKVLDRISELKTLQLDVTKSASDKANYQTEFTALKNQLTSLAAEQFNGVSIFAGAAASTLSVSIDQGNTQSVAITKANLNGTSGNVTSITGAATLDGLAVSAITTAIEGVATSRAQNGAEYSRLAFAADMLSTNKQNLESANSRIMDVDVAAESTQMARYSILVQSGTAMLAQANSSSQIALRLLG